MTVNTSRLEEEFRQNLRKSNPGDIVVRPHGLPDDVAQKIIIEERSRKETEMAWPLDAPPLESRKDAAEEFTGGSVNYYVVRVADPVSGGEAYTAECLDIIEALGMDYAEGNAFKAIWRRCAARLDKRKKGYDDGLYDAEKTEFYGRRMKVLTERRRNNSA